MEENKETKAEEITEEIAEDSAENSSAENTATDYEALCNEFKDKFLRVSAEYENFRKRTQKEKEALYSDGKAACAIAFLPHIDNMERAIEAAKNEDGDTSMVQGMELILKGLYDILKSLSIESIPSVGQQFDPEVHNAVMHVEDEEKEVNTVVEEFQKGYKMGDKVLRHSMVKVAN